MISRRLLRIKVFQVFYAQSKVEGKTYQQIDSDLTHSIRKSYELYHQLMLLILELRSYAERRIDIARQKKRPSAEDLHPNTRFIENRVLMQLEQAPELQKFVAKHGVNWVNFPELIKELFEQLQEYELYQNYMAAQEPAYSQEKKLLINIYQDIFMNSEELFQSLEEQSIFWLDDVDYLFSMIVRTIKGFNDDPSQEHRLLPMFRDDTDMDFARKLLRKALIHREEYAGYIEEATSNWEFERIAETDRIIMILAISEAVEFETIPTKVTMNEYIEVAKMYSTRKSSKFINGILDSVFAKLKSEKRIVKKGRGLIGETQTTKPEQ